MPTDGDNTDHEHIADEFKQPPEDALHADERAASSDVGLPEAPASPAADGLLPESDGSSPEAPPSAPDARTGPPEHWLQDIRERAPHLLERFGEQPPTPVSPPESDRQRGTSVDHQSIESGASSDITVSENARADVTEPVTSASDGIATNSRTAASQNTPIMEVAAPSRSDVVSGDVQGDGEIRRGGRPADSGERVATSESIVPSGDETPRTVHEQVGDVASDETVSKPVAPSQGTHPQMQQFLDAIRDVPASELPEPEPEPELVTEPETESVPEPVRVQDPVQNPVSKPMQQRDANEPEQPAAATEIPRQTNERSEHVDNFDVPKNSADGSPSAPADTPASDTTERLPAQTTQLSAVTDETLESVVDGRSGASSPAETITDPVKPETLHARPPAARVADDLPRTETDWEQAVTLPEDSVPRPILDSGRHVGDAKIGARETDATWPELQENDDIGTQAVFVPQQTAADSPPQFEDEPTSKLKDEKSALAHEDRQAAVRSSVPGDNSRRDIDASAATRVESVRHEGGPIHSDVEHETIVAAKQEPDRIASSEEVSRSPDELVADAGDQKQVWTQKPDRSENDTFIQPREPADNEAAPGKAQASPKFSADAPDPLKPGSSDQWTNHAAVISQGEPSATPPATPPAFAEQNADELWPEMSADAEPHWEVLQAGQERRWQRRRKLDCEQMGTPWNV